MRFQPWLTDSVWVLLGRASLFMGGLAVQMALARLLPQAELGQYFVWSSAVSVVSVLASLGAGPVAIRQISVQRRSGSRAETQGLTRAALRWGALGGLGASGPFFVIAALFTQSQLLPALAAGWMAVTAAESVLADVLRGFLDIRAATVLDEILGGWLGVLIVLALAALFPPLTVAGTLVGLGLGLMVAIAFGLSALARHLEPLPSPAAAPSVQWWWKQSGPVWLNTGLWLVFGQMDLWVLSILRPPAEVAVYGLASRLAILLNQPQVMSRAVLMPRLAALHAHGEMDALQRMVRGAATAAGALALVGTLGLALDGQWVLTGLFGAVYRTSLPVALILGCGYIVSSGAGLAETTLLMSGRQTLVVRGSMVSGFSTLVLLLVLTPPYGAIGAATAMAIGTIVQNLLMLGLARRTLGIWTCASVRLTEWRAVWRSLWVNSFDPKK
jgi:O-antigen/teichoic acid export membrane protein